LVKDVDTDFHFLIIRNMVKTIAVHDGSFHADDVFAAAALRIIYPDARIIRTRDVEELRKADFRVDVGGRHDPLNGDFDHHQNESVGVRENGIPYASIGLIWKHYGNQITGNPLVTDSLDQKLIQIIDANDNGYSMPWDGQETVPYSISRMVESFNPTWEDLNPDYLTAFEEVTVIAKRILQNEIKKMRGRDKAKDLVIRAMKESDGMPYILLDRACPWQDLVVEHSDALYVVHPSATGDWRIRAVPKTKGGFELRKPLPKAWAGLREQDLRELTGVAGAKFCHKERFIASAETQEDAETMAMLATDS
jgi:uncharacterized UPF0160 family protein